MSFSAFVQFDAQGGLTLSFSALSGSKLLSLGPFRSVCRLEEAVARLLLSARAGAPFVIGSNDGLLFLSASNHRWRLPVSHHDASLHLAHWATALPMLWLADQRPHERRRFDLSGPLARLMP